MKTIWLKIGIIILFAGGAFFVLRYKTALAPKRNQLNIDTLPRGNVSENIVNDSVSGSFIVSGWLPYWSKDKGAASLSENLTLFDEINPFAFEVDKEGTILDIAKINNAPWPELRKQAQEKNIKIIPTILWGDAEAMHRVFSDNSLLDNHVQAIENLLQKNNFLGVDIDYEGKDVDDRDNFTMFLKSLHQNLSQNQKSLDCTVEARTTDLPPMGFSETRAMSWANDFSALNNFCDSVRVMAYDQVFQINRANTFTDSNENPTAPNADIQWVGEVMRYASKYISPEKLMLGVPTYGWEFKLEKISSGYRYTRVKSVSFPEAMEKAREAGIAPARDSGGELSFIYQTAGEEHLITFSDAESVRQKITLAKNLGLKGISLFKLDGFSDPQLFSVLKEERLK